jgi:cell division protein FtsW (lipid II flippase)
LASVFRKKLSFKQLIFPTAAGMAIVMILVVATDLGSALIFFLTYMMIMYISTGKIILFALGLLGASGGAVIAYQFFSHVQVRVAAWQNPWVNMDTGGFQIVRSLFAIGTWGLLGSGLTRGLPGSVPVVESDFMFAAISEEFGSFFGIGLIGVFILLFDRGVHIALRCDRRYYSLLAAGFTSMLAFQTFIIIGGVTKFIPLTGITLPFVSYGGTSIVVSILMIGILQWVYIYNSKTEGQRSESKKQKRKGG